MLLRVILEQRRVPREGLCDELKQLRSKVRKLALGNAYLEAQLVQLVDSHTEAANLSDIVLSARGCARSYRRPRVMIGYDCGMITDLEMN